MKRLFIPALLLAAIAIPAAFAQNRMTYSVVSPDNGHIALGLAIRKLNVSGTFMQAPAHPDDETNALFALFTHGMGLRSVDVQNNRGEGGQNEIGPELFRDIGVLRTSELVAAHRIDGAEQYFTRAIDYGYSFDPEEVMNKWGRDAIIGLRAPDSHAPPRRDGDDEHPGPRRRPRARGDDGPRARGVSRGRQSRALSRADPRRAARVAAEEAVLFRGVRCSRCRWPRRSGRRGRRGRNGRIDSAPCDAREHRAVRRAARPHVRGNRQRRTQLSQVSGHQRHAGAAWLRRRTRRRRRGRRTVSARRHHDAGPD